MGKGGKRQELVFGVAKGRGGGCLFTIQKAADFLRKILTKYQFNLGQHRVMV
jgi:hypothetical protein